MNARTCRLTGRFGYSDGMYRIALVTLCTLGCAGPAGTASRPATNTTGPSGDQPEQGTDAMDWQSPLLRDHALVGRIWDTRERRFATREELGKRAAEARFVLVGETHDNADHHLLQAAVIDMVTGAARKPAVVFEMIAPDQKEAVDRQRQTAPGDVDGVGATLEWDKSGWPPWAIYRPIFASVVAAGLPIVGAALPRAQTMELALGKRQLPAELVATYKLGEPLPGDLQAALVAELTASHCGHMSEAMLAPMSGIQRARDALMADGLATGATADGAILIAGGGHVRSDRGVPFYLRLAGHPADKILAIGFIQVTAEAKSPADYARYYQDTLPFDYVWFTPVANDIDRCAELKERMKHKKTEMKSDEQGSGAQKAPAGE